MGGEYGASATYLSEMADGDASWFWSSLQYVTLIAGQLLALAVLIVLQALLSRAERSEAWGWRIPFVVGGPSPCPSCVAATRPRGDASFDW